MASTCEGIVAHVSSANVMIKSVSSTENIVEDNKESKI